MKKTLLGVALAVGLSAFAPSALADPSKKDNDYGYTFSDDLLAAKGIGGYAALIPVMRFSHRDRLLRPRVHFVQEMLKSVENM